MGAATPCKERIAQNECVDGRSGRFYVHRNNKPSTHRGGETGISDYRSERLNNEEAKKITELSGKIIEVIELEGEYTYKEVMWVLGVLQENYKKKGGDLLNDSKILEVAMYGNKGT